MNVQFGNRFDKQFMRVAMGDFVLRKTASLLKFPEVYNAAENDQLRHHAWLSKPETGEHSCFDPSKQFFRILPEDLKTFRDCRKGNQMNIPPPVRGDDKYRDLLTEIHSREDIPESWRDTPIESFIMAQNLGWPIASSGKVELLIATCIEFRYALPIPKMYAYVIRRASGRVIGSEFSVGYTLSQGVRYLIIIGHNDCGMSKVYEKAPNVVQAFIEQGWERDIAEEYVQKQVARHAINDEIEALHHEYLRLSKVFRKLVIAPLFVCLHDSRLYIPRWLPGTKSELDLGDDVPTELIRNLP